MHYSVSEGVVLSILYIVATPIGNLNDISFRAIEILKHVNYIACEDTRHSQHLLRHYDINTPVFSYHDHNESASAEKIVNHIKKGESVALVSDAGTPLISDPGYEIVKRAHQENIRVIPIPGACAAMTALSASGLASDRFIFEGFLPVKQQARQNRLKKLMMETRTLIFYEAPHRIHDMLNDIKIIMDSERQITIARELTKTFEIINKNTVKNLVLPEPKGEFVVILSGIGDAEREKMQQHQAQELVQELYKALSLKKAVALSAKMYDVSKNTLYQWAIKSCH